MNYDNYAKPRNRADMTGMANPTTSASKLTRAVRIDKGSTYEIERMFAGHWECVTDARHNKGSGLWYMDGEEYRNIKDLLESAEKTYK